MSVDFFFDKIDTKTKQKLIMKREVRLYLSIKSLLYKFKVLIYKNK